MNALIRAGLLAGTIVFLAGTPISAVWSQSKTPSLFKVVTEKDEIIIGLNTQELHALGGSEKNAGAVARALADKKELTVWQYSVRKSPSGDLQVTPLHQVGLLANQSLRSRALFQSSARSSTRLVCRRVKPAPLATSVSRDKAS